MSPPATSRTIVLGGLRTSATVTRNRSVPGIVRTSNTFVRSPSRLVNTRTSGDVTGPESAPRSSMRAAPSGPIGDAKVNSRTPGTGPVGPASHDPNAVARTLTRTRRSNGRRMHVSIDGRPSDVQRCTARVGVEMIRRPGCRPEAHVYLPATPTGADGCISRVRHAIDRVAARAQYCH